MRPGLKPDTVLDRLAIGLNLAPVPAGQALFGMPMSRVIAAGQRLGIFARLARAPARAQGLAAELDADAGGVRMLLDSLAALRALDRQGETYRLSRRARKWLDPASESYVGTYIEHTADYWAWWERLEEVVRTGEGVEIHAFPPDDPSWDVYIRGQFELARISSPEVAKALRLPSRPASLVDVAGGHGWYSAELCRRHPTLRATVVDLPGSARVGRRIMAEQGMSDRVRHVDGDMMSADLAGPHDGALLFNIAHHLTAEQNVTLLRRVHDAVAPGGTVGVLDLWLPEHGRRPDSAALLGLFFYLTSAAATYAEADVRGWLGEAGFGEVRRVKIRRLPGQMLFEARRPG